MWAFAAAAGAAVQVIVGPTPIHDGEAKSAGRPSVFMLINDKGRNVGLAIKLDPVKSATPAPTGAG